LTLLTLGRLNCETCERVVGWVGLRVECTSRGYSARVYSPLVS